MDFAAPYKGNFILSIESLEKNWANEGNIIYLFPRHAEVLPWVDKLISEGKRVHFIDSTFFSKKILWRNIRTLINIIALEHINIIHTHFLFHNYTLFIYSKLFGHSVKILASLHNHYEPSGRLAVLKTWVFKNTFDLYIGVSDSASNSVLQIGITPNKVTTVRNAIDFSRLNNFEKLKGIDVSKPTIFMLGHPWHRKGVDIVVKTIDKLNSVTERKNIQLLITVSGGEDIVKSQIEFILGYLPNWVIFLPPREDLATYYNAADIFISASREEGFSYALVEAAYCSNPNIISSNIPAPMSLKIPHMQIFENENTEDLEKLIIEVLAIEPNEKLKIKAEQRRYALNEFDLDRWAQKISKCYT